MAARLSGLRGRDNGPPRAAAPTPGGYTPVGRGLAPAVPRPSSRRSGKKAPLERSCPPSGGLRIVFCRRQNVRSKQGLQSEKAAGASPRPTVVHVRQGADSVGAAALGRPPVQQAKTCQTARRGRRALHPRLIGGGYLGGDDPPKAAGPTCAPGPCCPLFLRAHNVRPYSPLPG